MNSTPDHVQGSLLRSRRYGLFWISSLLSNIGTWMQQVAEPWVVLSLSHSPFWVGFDSFAMNAPGWIFTLWGGVLADRKDRRQIILFFQGIQLLCVLALVSLLVLGWLKVWMIVLISFMVGLTDSLSMPSFQSIIPSLVNAEDIPRAVSLNSAQFNLSRLLGPAIAGIVIAKYGAVACFGANAISYFPFFLSLYWIYPRGLRGKKAKAPAAQPISQMSEYGKFIRMKEVRTPLMTVLITALFCSPLVTFCPVIVKDIFHADVGEFGSAMAGIGLGGLLGAGLSMVSLPKRIRRDQLSIGIAVSLGIILVLIALNHSFLILMGLLVFAGATMTISNVGANSFLQQAAGPFTRGRMASLYQLAIHGGMSIGALVTGLSVTHWGISRALLVNGVVAITLQMGILWGSRSQRLPSH